MNSKALLPENIVRFDLTCPSCGDLRNDHAAGTYDWTAHTVVYERPCDNHLTNKWLNGIHYPYNVFLFDGKWYFFSYRATLTPYMLPVTIALAIRQHKDVVHPRMDYIETYGDIYNFCANHNILDRLTMLVGPDKFKAMQAKSLIRTIQKIGK